MKLKDDKGSVSLMGVMAIFCLLLVAGLVIDVSKNFQMKIALQDAANDAATAAISEVHQSGSLRGPSGNKAIENYEKYGRPTVQLLDDRYPTIGYNIVYSRSNNAVGGMGGNIPITEMKNIAAWPKNLNQVKDLNAKKRKEIDRNNSDTITIYIYEEVPNYLLGLLGPKFKTQKIMVKATATTLTADAH